jgi:predicted GH43/DUF377 family glycosyl hydrolase
MTLVLRSNVVSLIEESFIGLKLHDVCKSIERLNGGQPIISPNSHKWESGCVFNTAAVYLPRSEDNDNIIRGLLGTDELSDPRLSDGVVALHYRARPDDEPGLVWSRSYVGLAVFTPGMELIKRFEEPVLGPVDDPNHPDHYGVEDPRITFLDGWFYMLYCGCSFRYNGDWVGSVCLARSKDLINWERLGPVQGGINQEKNEPGSGSCESYVNNKDAVFFPQKVKGKYAMLHRPMKGDRGTHGIHLAVCDTIDGVWHNCGRILAPYYNDSWKALWIGAGSEPISLGNDRYLAITHSGGVLQNDRVQYNLDAVLINFQDFDSNLPAEEQQVVEAVIDPFMVPETRFELEKPFKHSVENVVFTCGSYLYDEYVYIAYGAADTYVSAARIRKDELLKALEDQKRIDSGKNN